MGVVVVSLEAAVSLSSASSTSGCAVAAAVVVGSEGEGAASVPDDGAGLSKGGAVVTRGGSIVVGPPSFIPRRRREPPTWEVRNFRDRAKTKGRERPDKGLTNGEGGFPKRGTPGPMVC